MSFHLTVVSPFGGHKKGDHITDPAEVAAVLAGPNSHSVVKRFPHPEHASGDFYRTNAQLRERAEAAFKKPEAKAK